MKYYLSIIATVMLFVAGCRSTSKDPVAGSCKKQQPIRVAVVTGGHGFEKEPFLDLFAGHEDIQPVHIPLQDHSEIFEETADWPYDCIVLFNMTQKISPKRQANFIELLKNGTGLVALHHAIGAYQTWPEFEKIIGGKYYLPETAKSQGHKPSGYKHDVEFTVTINDKDHTVTKGIENFTINDETYKDCVFEPDNLVLLTTTDPTSDRSIGWARSYQNARICYIQPGHGKPCFEDENYRKLIANAIRWAGGG